MTDKDLKVCKCVGCERIYLVVDLEHQFPDIPDLAARVVPGDITPVGECADKECRALCYPFMFGPGEVLDCVQMALWLFLNDQGAVEWDCKKQTGELSLSATEGRAAYQIVKQFRKSPRTGPMKNTLISCMDQDGSNGKHSESAVFSGEITEDDAKRMIDHSDEDVLMAKEFAEKPELNEACPGYKYVPTPMMILFEREETTMENTVIAYMYHDAVNCNQAGYATFAGLITAEECESLLDHCVRRTYFIPSQVGLKDLQNQLEDLPIEDMDRGWHKLLVIWNTEKPPTEPGDIHEFVEKFCKTKWDEMKAMVELGLYRTHDDGGES